MEKPVFIREEHISALLVEHRGHVPQDIALVTGDGSICIQEQDMAEVLRAQEVLLQHAVLLPIEILTLVPLRAFLLGKLSALLPLPCLQLRLARQPPDHEAQAVLPGVVPVCGEDSTQPPGPRRGRGSAPEGPCFHKDRLHNQHASMCLPPRIDHQEVLPEEPGRPGTLGLGQTFAAGVEEVVRVEQQRRRLRALHRPLYRSSRKVEAQGALELGWLTGNGQPRLRQPILIPNAAVAGCIRRTVCERRAQCTICSRDLCVVQLLVVVLEGRPGIQRRPLGFELGQRRRRAGNVGELLCALLPWVHGPTSGCQGDSHGKVAAHGLVHALVFPQAAPVDAQDVLRPECIQHCLRAIIRASAETKVFPGHVEVRVPRATEAFQVGLGLLAHSRVEVVVDAPGIVREVTFVAPKDFHVWLQVDDVPGVHELGGTTHACEPGVGVPAAVLARHPLEGAPEPLLLAEVAEVHGAAILQNEDRRLRIELPRRADHLHDTFHLVVDGEVEADLHIPSLKRAPRIHGDGSSRGQAPLLHQLAFEALLRVRARPCRLVVHPHASTVEASPALKARLVVPHALVHLRGGPLPAQPCHHRPQGRAPLVEESVEKTLAALAANVVAATWPPALVGPTS
mmetsp:Transcript_133048/g.315351  ORF Transcript_133048/g.315351 Transcript_133048/m.315351 type:complete len:625 (-) Transcript_133048:785-2659(-)